MDNRLKQYYENEGLEDLRLDKSSVHYTEFLTITKYLDLLLKPNSKILDPCAGTGVYSFYLADKNHLVTAGDLIDINIKVLKQKENRRIKNKCNKLEKIYLGNILDLSNFKEETFDCVLCMGALYHLMDEGQRIDCIKQCLRVLKKGGILVATYVNRYGAIACNFNEDVNDIDEILSFLSTGKLDVFYSHTPSEIEDMFEKFPLKPLYHIGADGIGFLLYGVCNTITDKGLVNFRKYHLLTCENRDLLGYSYHGAYFLEKK